MTWEVADRTEDHYPGGACSSAFWLDTRSLEAMQNAGLLSTPPGAVPQWDDPQLLNCIIATLAANPPECDLQAIYGEADYIAGPLSA